ncbi:hypothetical protein E0L21_23865 [Kosakonia quasisacchari]|uniref:Uncharacterized protein n=2 Tax=Kosakonia quasisacchari TaxID=2529380 RepID=A0A4R0GGX5_9ENTR|nr:hypothetical protein E0L21_23865 [Kosakonia quasisacchari]
MRKMTENAIKNELQDWNDKLVRVCADFVRFKDDLDASNKTSYVQSPLIRRFRGFSGLYEPNKINKYRTASAICPSDFANEALPFICVIDINRGEYKKCQINPQLVVSGKYRDYRHAFDGGYADIFPEDVMNASDKFIAESDTHSTQYYYRPKILPLYIALEGKNRIELFKRYRRTMLAWVAETPSVPVSELTLIQLRPFNVWAVCYSGQRRILPFPQISLPVYKTLGVAEVKPGWDFLALSKLRKARIRATRHQMRM